MGDCAGAKQVSDGAIAPSRPPLVITKRIFNYNSNFSLAITSKVQKVYHKYTFTHKLTTNATFRRHLYFLAQTFMEWNALIVKDTSMLPSKIDQMKESHGSKS